MSVTTHNVLRCTRCGRAIEACACCDERDCPPPLCEQCLRELLLKATRPGHVHHSTSITEP